MTEYVRLGDVASINPPKKLVSHLADETVVGFIPMDAVSNEGKMERIDTRKYSEVKKGFVYFADGDILFAKITPCMENGKGAIVSGMPNGIGFGSTEFHVVRPNNEMTYERYIHYFLKNPSLRKLLENKMTGSAGQKRVSKDTLKELIIPLPPLSEQKRIAAALDTMSSVISRRKRQIELLDEAAKSLFVEMFGDPVENPMGWDVVELKKLSTKIGSGSTPKGGSQSYVESGISLIRSLNVYNNRFKIKDLAHITPEQAKKLDNVTLQKNDVLINITGASVARSCIVPDDVLPARVNQHVSIIRCIPSVLNPIYLNYFLTDGNYQHILLSVGEDGGATREAITKSQLEALGISLPPIDLQNLFAARIEALEAERASCERGLSEMEMAFSAMMQEYFG